jgi:hypothetical protein
MRPVRNVFQKLSRTEQRREGIVAYLWLEPLFILCRVAGRYGYSSELAELSKVRLKLRPLPVFVNHVFSWTKFSCKKYHDRWSSAWWISNFEYKYAEMSLFPDVPVSECSVREDSALSCVGMLALFYTPCGWRTISCRWKIITQNFIIVKNSVFSYLPNFLSCIKENSKTFYFQCYKLCIVQRGKKWVMSGINE